MTAHGTKFSSKDKYPEEDEKLLFELQKSCYNNIKIIGIVIEESARNSFDECKKSLPSKEICELVIDLIKKKISK